MKIKIRNSMTFHFFFLFLFFTFYVKSVSLFISCQELVTKYIRKKGTGEIFTCSLSLSLAISRSIHQSLTFICIQDVHVCHLRNWHTWTSCTHINVSYRWIRSSLGGNAEYTLSITCREVISLQKLGGSWYVTKPYPEERIHFWNSGK